MSAHGLRFSCRPARRIALAVAVASATLLSSVASAESKRCIGSNYQRWTDCDGRQAGPNFIYEGHFVNGKPDGRGTLQYLTGSTYTGEFKAGQPEGQGSYSFVNGDRYIGEMKQGELTGKGRLSFSNGDVYEGPLKRALPHGVGTFTYRSGTRYVGNFSEGVVSGRGVLSFANGDEYSGQFIDEYFQGEGTLTFADGTRYQGQFDKGLFSGHGKLTFPSGENYVGGFKNHTYWGDGIYLLADGTKYVGHFEDGFHAFQGVLTFTNGDSFVGELRDGKPTGEGMYFGTDGQATLQVSSHVLPTAIVKPELSASVEAAGQGSAAPAAIPPSSLGANPVLEEIKRLREGWLRLADAKLRLEQTAADERLDSERRKIDQERAELDAERKRLEQQRAHLELELASGGADLEHRKQQEADAREALLLAESRLRQDDVIAAANFAKEKQRLDEERARLEAEKRRLQQEATLRPIQPVVDDKRRRVALVIGNGKYAAAPLRNPENDARSMAQALGLSGFKVTMHANLNLKQMRSTLREFAQGISRGDVALFYFSGHGAEYNGKGRLIAVEENPTDTEELPDRSVDADRVLEQMTRAGAELSILILDACRSNPYSGERAAAGGLPPLQAGKGSLIAYSTAPGTTAADGVGKNSPYTKHLVQAMELRGIPMERMFKEVRAAVAKETSDKQIPWENSSVIGEFYFRP